MRKRIITIVLAVTVLWLAAGVTDFIRVMNYNLPLFCITSGTVYDDGGSGRYVGLGYYFDIEGNFMPLDKSPGVTKYTVKIFGITVRSEEKTLKTK